MGRGGERRGGGGERGGRSCGDVGGTFCDHGDTAGSGEGWGWWGEGRGGEGREARGAVGRGGKGNGVEGGEEWGEEGRGGEGCRSCGDVGGPHCNARDDCRQRGGEGRARGRAGEAKYLLSTTIHAQSYTFSTTTLTIVPHNNYHYLCQGPSGSGKNGFRFSVANN